MLKNLKISLRLGLSFSLIMLIMITIILLSLNQIRISRNMFDRILKVNNVRLHMANTMIDHTREVSINLRNALLLKNNDQTQAIKYKIDSLRNQYDMNFKLMEGLITADDTLSFIQISKIKIFQEASRRLNDEVMNKSLNGDHDGAILIMNQQASTAVNNWIQSIDNFIKHTEDRNVIRYNQAGKAQDSARLYMSVLGILALLLSFAISFFLTRSITKPLTICVNAADKIASNDLTSDPQGFENRKDEFGILVQSLNKMTAILREQIHEILEGVNILSSSSSEILSTTTETASSSSETAAAISETTSTVEEVRQAAQLSSQKAKNLSESAQHVAQISQGGQKSVEETISGMNHIHDQIVTIEQAVVRLSEQSHSIGSIIASVTDIADQSNLLAVNAAIEAAKAGDQGKGFAVVANEIRNLADQSKQATLQVRNILNDIQKATNEAVLATEQANKVMETGMKQSLQTGEAIRVLTDSTKEVLQVSTQIVASSQQQLIGMDQIGVAMQSINQAGIETAAGMNQSEKAAKNLNDLGRKLKELIEKFKV